MIDYHSTLVTALKTILPTYYELALHSGIKTPCISYMETNNYVDTNGDTLGYSRIVYQVKVWGNEIKDLQLYAQQIDNVLRPLGWTRTSSGELFDRESTMCQKIMTYEALGLDTPLINYNGARVTNPKDPNYPTTDLRISRDDLLEIIDFTKDDLINVFCEIIDDIYVQEYNEFIHPFLHINSDFGKLHIGKLRDTLPDDPNGSLFFLKKGTIDRFVEHINNNYKGYQGKKNTYQGRVYPPGYLDKLYANYNSPNDSVEDYKKSNGITNLNDLIENNE